MVIYPSCLGSQAFRDDYGLKYAYVAGAMYKGIASVDLVVKMGQAGLLGFLGTGGLNSEKIEQAIQNIQSKLEPHQAYGMNLICHLDHPEIEDQTVDLFLKQGITRIEAAAFMQMTPSLVRYRLKNLSVDSTGKINIPHQIIAKVSRPEVATVFMSPAPIDIVQDLVNLGLLTQEEAKLGETIPMSHDICVESDSGGHTDQGVAYVLVPAMKKLRDEMMQKYGYEKEIRVGAAGGIGTPEAAAAAFTLGADFIVTGSINQCTVEAGTSDQAKDMLQAMNIQDTAYAPAGDMFELGAKVQVLRKGLFFPARANKLFDLYRMYNSLDEIDEKTRQQIQDKYFKRSFEEVWQETNVYYSKTKPEEIEKAERSPKHKMALIFKWYFIYTTRLTLRGDEDNRVDYQIHSGPALGAFNQWVKGTKLEEWRNRHVDEIAELLMQEAAKVLARKIDLWYALSSN